MGRNRYPAMQKRTDGTKGCRGCGGDIPKGRFSWCSNDCYKKHDPAHVRSRCLKRSKGLCEKCGRDFVKDRLGMEEYHHIIPFSEGGPTNDENMQVLCRDCHLTETARWRRKKAEARKPGKQLELPL